MPTKLYIMLLRLFYFTVFFGLTSVNLYAQTTKCDDDTYFFFDFDQSTISPVSQVKNELSKLLNNDVLLIQLSGHTDSTGNQFYNNQLSKKRVEFIQNLIPTKYQSLVKSDFHGENNNNAKLILQDYNSNNRRVHLVVKYACKDQIITNDEQAAVDGSKNGELEYNQTEIDQIEEVQTITRAQQVKNEADSLQLSAFITQYVPDTIIAIFDQSQSKAMLTDKHTLLLVQEETFVRKDGTVPTEVNLSVQEFYDIKSIMAAKLNTKTTSGTWLESGGMLYIEASDEKGESLDLQKPITIGVPREDSIGYKSDMQLYNGVESANGIKWELNNIPTYQKPSKIDFKQLAVEVGKEVGNFALDEISETSGAAKAGVKLFRFFANNNKSIKGEDKRIYNKGVKNGEINAEKAEEKKKYLFNVTQMGYVNCDRSALADYPGKDITVKLKKVDIGLGSEIIYLIFPSINSLTAPDGYDRFSSYDTFEKIPEGIDIVLISLKIIDGEMYLAKETTQASEEPIIPIYSKVTDEEFEREVEGFLNF